MDVALENPGESGAEGARYRHGLVCIQSLRQKDGEIKHSRISRGQV